MPELRALVRCLTAQLKMEMTYRVNFWVGLISQMVFSLLSIVFIDVFLPEGARINGWGFWEIVFLFGVGDMTFGLSAILVFRSFLVFDSAYILEGELDALLVQPVHPLFNLILRNLNVNDVLTAVKGAIIVVISSIQAGFVWSPATFLMLLFGIGVGAATYCGIFILLLSTGFWFARQSSIVAPLLSLNQLAQYPIFIYPEWLKIILSTIVPLGFVAYYPSEALLTAGGVLPGYALEGWVLLLLPLTVLLSAFLLFNRGLRRYSSAGS